MTDQQEQQYQEFMKQLNSLPLKSKLTAMAVLKHAAGDNTGRDEALAELNRLFPLEEA